MASAERLRAAQQDKTLKIKCLSTVFQSDAQTSTDPPKPDCPLMISWGQTTVPGHISRVTGGLRTAYRGEGNSRHYRRMFNLVGNEDDTNTAAQQVPLGRAASKDEDSKKNPLKMCVHLVLHHTICTALSGKKREMLPHQS